MRDIRHVKRILVRATNWIGDSIMTLPALMEIRRNFPHAQISVLLRPWVRPIFESLPYVDQIINYDKKKGMVQNLAEFVRITSLLRAKRFDMAILFQNAFEAALIAFLSGIRVRLGHDTDGRGFLLSHPVKKGKGQHQIRNYLDLLKGIGLEVEEMDPLLSIKGEYIANAQSVLKENDIEPGEFVIALAPGAIYGPAKRWPAEYFAIIGDWIRKRWGAKVLIMGSDRERDVCSHVQAMMKEGSLNLCGKTSLGTSMGIIKNCNMLVSNDSGLMHVGAALGVPTVAIFGSTDPQATGPRGAYCRIIKHDIPCSPCFRRECPYDLECLYSVRPEDVWEKMEELQNEASSLPG